MATLKIPESQTILPKVADYIRRNHPEAISAMLLSLSSTTAVDIWGKITEVVPKQVDIQVEIEFPHSLMYVLITVADEGKIVYTKKQSMFIISESE